MRLFVALLPLITGSPVTDEDVTCGENEQFRECAYCSEESCTEPMMCARSCEEGDFHCCLAENVCYCKSGFKRNENGDCVEECKPTCDGKNEFWAECGSSCHEQFCPCQGFLMPNIHKLDFILFLDELFNYYNAMAL